MTMKSSIVLAVTVIMALAAFGPARADEVIGHGMANSNIFSIEAGTVTKRGDCRWHGAFRARTSHGQGQAALRLGQYGRGFGYR